ncbi:MAG: ATP-binding protein [Prevotella sp.]|nr:ATP-binding protein [Prevotella sp.]
MKYPIGIQNFEKLRREGYAYVDKTPQMWKMISEGSYYFLSRPRRFGKSLMVSTLEAFFSGQRELFKGLFADTVEWDWQQYPILHLDLNVEKYTTLEALDNILDNYLCQWESLYGRADYEKSFGARFMGIMRRAYEQTGRQVVILVDEYDKPMLQAIGNEALQAEYRSTLKAFYGALKSGDRYIKFAFLTGVTKFGKVSVFSDLNNLEDLTMLPQYSAICGISEAEIRACFDEGVGELAKANGMTKEECYERLRFDFDGYHFNVGVAGMYNPFSLLNTLKNQTFRDYWFETGTPSFLVYQLQKTNYPLEMMTREELFEDTLNSIEIMDENPLPLLFQSGYLTIKGYNQRFGTYLLGFPNREVEEGFVKYLVPFYSPNKVEKPQIFIVNFVRDVENGNADSFMQRVERFFDGGDYQVAGKAELYFQNTLWALFKLLGLYVDVERHTTDGRMDILVQTKDYVYILELKIDQTAEAALQQIEEKQYAKPFEGDGRTIYKIGVSFSSETRRLTEWKVGS